MACRGRTCLVIEKRPRIGGNCCTETRDGIDVHMHSPHTFHTDSTELWNYVKRYAELASLKHTVKACNGGRLYSFPITLATLKQVFGVESGEQAFGHEPVLVPHRSLEPQPAAP